MGGSMEDLCAGPAYRQGHKHSSTLGLTSTCYSSSVHKALIPYVFMWCDLMVFPLVLGIVLHT